MLLQTKILLFPPRRRACRQAGIAGAINKVFKRQITNIK
jgi:hypothetical protein